MPTRSLWQAVVAALRLNCPRCGAHTLFRGLFTMNRQCSVCELLFEREPGYFVGAIYINYAATAVIAIGGFLVLDELTTVSVTTQIVCWSIFGIAFPLLFFRYSRSLWLALDHFINPEEPPVRLARRTHV